MTQSAKSDIELVGDAVDFAEQWAQDLAPQGECIAAFLRLKQSHADMLDTLEEALSWLEEWDEEHTGIAYTIREAIAKAKGGQP